MDISDWNEIGVTEGDLVEGANGHYFAMVVTPETIQMARDAWVNFSTIMQNSEIFPNLKRQLEMIKRIDYNHHEGDQFLFLASESQVGKKHAHAEKVNDLVEKYFSDEPYKFPKWHDRTINCSDADIIQKKIGLDIDQYRDQVETYMRYGNLDDVALFSGLPADKLEEARRKYYPEDFDD